MDRLAEKVVVISGAARGQGEAEARLFVAEGARVLLGDVLDDDPPAIVATEIADGFHDPAGVAELHSVPAHRAQQQR